MILPHRQFSRSTRFARRPAPAVVLGLALALGLSTAASEAADPFYLDLLRDGKAAYARGDLETAVWNLQVACFGLLDEPPLLAESLVHLALAQADTAAADTVVAKTIARVLEVEEKFSAYSQASLAGEIRGRFLELLYRRADPARLAGLEAFSSLAERRELESLTAAPPDQRRATLEQRLSADPTDTRWLRMLADLEISQNRAAAAVPHLSLLLAQSPT